MLLGEPFLFIYAGLAHNTYLVVAILRATMFSGGVQLTPRIISASLDLKLGIFYSILTSILTLLNFFEYSLMRLIRIFCAKNDEMLIFRVPDGSL